METFRPAAPMTGAEEGDRMRHASLVVIFCMLPAGCAAGGRLHKKALEHNLAGLERLREGDFMAARASFLLALEYNHDFSEAWNNLGVLALREGDHGSAMEFFSRAIKLNPDFGEAWNNVGILHMAAGELDEAGECFLTALKSNPGHVEARLNLVQVLVSGGDAESGELEIMKVLQQEPERPEALLLLAAIRIEKKDFVRAGVVLEQVLELHPQEAEAWLLLAVWHLKMDRPAAARKALARADLLAPAETLWVRLGLAHLAAGSVERAGLYFKKAQALSGHDPYAAAGLVLYHAETGEAGELDKACKRFLSLKPGVSQEADEICSEP
jgi:Flp pilus assembly protein TadD